MSEQDAEKAAEPSEAVQRFSQPAQEQRSESAEEAPAKRPIRSSPVPVGRLVSVAVPIAVIGVVLAWLVRPLLAIAVLAAVALAALGVLIARSMGNRSRSGGSTSPRPSLWSRRPRSQPGGGTTRRPLFPGRSSAVRTGSGSSGSGRSSSSRFFGTGRASAGKPPSSGRQGIAGRIASARKGSSTSTGRSRFSSPTSKPGAGSTATRSPAGKSTAGRTRSSSGRRWFGFGKSKSTQPKPSSSASGTTKRTASAPQSKPQAPATAKHPTPSGRGSRWPFKSRRSGSQGGEPRRYRNKENATDRTRDLQSARDGKERASRRVRHRDRDDNRDGKNRPDNGTTTSPIKGDSAGANQKNKTPKEGKAAQASGGQDAKRTANAAGEKKPGDAVGQFEMTYANWQKYLQFEQETFDARRAARAKDRQQQSTVTNLPHADIRPEQPKPAPVAKDDPRMEALAAAVRKAGSAPAASRQEGHDMYAHMIDTSTPETRAATTREAADAARKSSAYHDEQADRFFAQAAVLRNQVGMAGAANGMQREGMKARETAENRRGYAMAFDQAAETFVAERNRTAS